MENLNFDPIKVDTALAEKYLKEHNNFEDWPLSKNYWHVKNYPNERDEYDVVRGNTFVDIRGDIPESITRAHLGRKLAVKLKANEVLFSQLEYTIRKTDAVDVNNNIKLISQHLQCCDLSSWNGDHHKTLHIIMDEKTPLYALGCVATALYAGMNFIIVTPQKMAPLCYLFFELCSELGWKIPLIFTHDTMEYYEELKDQPFFYVENRELGCTGVVTESADIDSALDLFINSSVTAPWKLQRIFVQESIYDEVKDALAWKCTREQVDSCADAFVTNGKIFLCDMLSAESGGAGGEAARVRVEAYRTAKEVIALLAQHPSSCLSVWAADSQHSHELALAAPASLVWVNDYAAFDGPPKASLPVYENMYAVWSYGHDGTFLDDLTKLRNPWAKMTENDRVDLIMNALQDFRSAQSQGSDEAVKLQDAIQTGLKDSFASVHGGRFWIGVERSPRDVIDIEVSCNLDLLKIINSTINGSAVVYYFNNNRHDESKESEFLGLMEFLGKAGVPVMQYDDTALVFNSRSNPFIRQECIYRKLKVISTNFGTIFAN